MSKNDVFEKRHDEEDLLNDVSGVLDHLNLPPAFVEFVRKNKRFLQILTAIIVILTVFFSLYGSYRENKIEDAAFALSSALKEPTETRVPALRKVVEEFRSTPSALWAKVEIAHNLMDQKKYQDAVNAYQEISSDIKESNPAYGLSLYGMAQAYEMTSEFQKSMEAYKRLEDIEGYKTISYAGVARMFELMGDKAKALEVYEIYLTEIAGLAPTHPEKILVEGKIEELRSVL